MESRTASGLIVEDRAAYPTPGTVGPDVAVPGDPSGVQIVGTTPPASRLPPIRPSPWAGWPVEWATPNWQGQMQALTDTAWTCLDLNSSVLSTMPPYLVGASPSLAVDWLNNPDPDTYTAWPEFAKQLFWDFQLGEVFVLATAYYSNGYPARFHVVPPWTVNAELAGDGTRRYSIGEVDVTPDMLHIRYTSTVGDAHGHGPLEVGNARLVAAGTLMQYASNLVASGGIPHSVLTHPQRLTAEQASELVYQWADARVASMGLTAVLSGGVDFKTIAVDPEKMALVDLSKWNESRIAVLLGTPPFLVGLPSGGDPMTYSNTQWVFVYHWRAGLSPKAATVMQALSQWLLPRGTSIEVNRDEYTKAELKERAETWQIFLSTGVLSIDEVRELERYGNAAPSPVNDLTSGVLQ